METPPGPPPPPPPREPPPLPPRGPTGAPPPPINVPGNAIRSQPVKITSQQLSLGLKKLKRPDQIKKLVDVSREDCFDKFKKYRHIPLVDSREYLRTIRADIMSISLHGVEQLTDAFLYSLYHCKISLPLLQWMSLGGCYNITDEGVFWVSLAFPSMHSLSVEGCRKVTEKSLFYIREHCPKIEVINMAMTSCGVLPLNIMSSNIKQLVTVGCPLISDDAENIGQSQTEQSGNLRKMVILTNRHIKLDPLSILTGEKGESRPGFVYKEGWRPFTKSDNKDLKDVTYNIFQVSEELAITDLFLSPGTIVVLPFMAVGHTVRNTAKYLAPRITSVTTKCEDCTFVLLGLYEESAECKETELAQQIHTKVERYVSQHLKDMSYMIKDSIYTNWRMEALDFHEQEILSNAVRLKRQTAQLFNKKVIDSVKLKDAIAVTCRIMRAGQQATNLEFLEKLAMEEQKLFPWLRPAIKPQKTWHAGDIYSTLTSLADLCSTTVVKETYSKHPLAKLEKSVSIAALQGQTLFYPDMIQKPMISDFPLLSQLLDKLFVKPGPRKCDISCLGNAIPCWKLQDIEDIWPQADKRQVMTLIRLLEKHGCLMRFVLDEWSNIRDVAYVYVCYKDLPSVPHDPLQTIDRPCWQIHKEKVYLSYPGLPQSFFPNILRHVLKLGGQIHVWKNGVVIDKGPQSVVIEKLFAKTAETAIVVQVRTLVFSDKVSIQSTWALLNVYTRIVDYLAQKYRVYLIKLVPCIVCSVDKTRQELADDANFTKKGSQKMYMEHIVRLGDNRVLQCTCNSSTNANVQLGSPISAQGLVPIHEADERSMRESKGWNSNNYFNRCLMCNNCASDGDHCKANLLTGRKNWSCDCERRGTICDSCGMCSRCTLYLKKLATTLEPTFEAPKSERYDQDQLQALDEVAVTEKGSILGFIEAQVEMPLETDVMHPTYCPNLNITLIKQGYICLKLMLYKLPRPVVLRYNCSTGVVTRNGAVEGQADSSSCLELGDTLGVSLKYTMTSRKHRLPSCVPIPTALRTEPLYGELLPNRIYVGELPDLITEEELMTIFSQHGKVEQVIIAKTLKGNRKGFGFVVFENVSDAQKVITETTSKKLKFKHNNHVLTVAPSVVEHRSFSHMEVALKKNGITFYSFQITSQPVDVTLSNETSEGVFVQVETPGKIRHDPITVEEARKKNHCGEVVRNLPCATEMKLLGLLDNMEDTYFLGSGISLSGATCLTMPSEITLDKLKYPSVGILTPTNYHYLCLSWNPLGGKSRKPKTYMDKDQTGAAVWNFHNNYQNWHLTQLAHLVNAGGISADLVSNVDIGASFYLMVWHLICLAYPRVLLPADTSKLLPGISVTAQSEIQVQEGLRGLIRAGLWQHFSQTDMTEIKSFFKVSKAKKPMMTSRKKIAAYVMMFQENLESHIPESGLVPLKSRYNSNLQLYMCTGHSECMKCKNSLSAPPSELMGINAIFLSFLDLSFNHLTEIPSVMFEKLENLVDLKLNHNFLEEIPGSIGKCQKLHMLTLTENNLTSLPDELVKLKKLIQLEVGSNRFKTVPPIIFKLTKLRKLMLSHMMLTEIPEEIRNLVNLKFLFIQGNCFTKLPKGFNDLQNLEQLSLGAIPYWKVPSNMKVLTFENFETFLRNKNLERWIEASSEDCRELFSMFDENANGVLEENEIGKLNAVMFNLFPRFGYKGKEAPDDQTLSGFPMEILQCCKLRILQIQHHAFTHVPREIKNLVNLTELNVSFNPNLLSVPAELGNITSLTKLGVDDCPLLKTPPIEIRKKGFHSCMAYLQRLVGGAVKTKRTKLMMVGLGGAGKTSLVEALLSDDCKADLQQGGVITDGIDIKTWNAKHKEDKIIYNVWDFAGQTVYYNTHQFFLSTNRAIYLLLWNVRLGYEHAGLDFWLNSIQVQAPNTPIFVIGSHIDQVSKPEIPIEEIHAKYPQIAGFHFVSSFTGKGIAELKECLFDVTLQQQYMGEDIPSVWLKFEQMVKKETMDIVAYDFVKHIANKAGIFEESEIFEAVQFLHDLGSVQHFTNDYLKTKVVINPQWIVDAMACVVSVKTDVIQEGRLDHADITRIWADYPVNLHTWLLRLTEEFNLTFPLKDKPVNLVPCLLPDRKPKINWPELEKGTDLRETKMVYKFDYLPAGLFNRGQVRLHHLSDSSMIWKKGSYLKKNVHIALLQQTGDSVLEVLVQGPRPENILFLVHEVFESLITESFQGIKYDFSMPCPDCQRIMLKDPHMFDGSTIRRAIDMKAPFLQCIKSFHTISCSILLTMLPPDNHSDFDAHLIQTVQGLKDLRKDLTTDVFISCNDLDTRLDEKVYITPGKVFRHLTDQGYRCWINDPSSNQSNDEMYKALIDCSVLLAFVSGNYANDEECVGIFKYARLTLKKTIVVVAIGDGFEWKTSKLGILLSDEVFINMIKPKYDYFDQKFDELIASLKGKTRIVDDLSAKPVVFISYTWVNSGNAVAKGTRSVPGAVGYGDPRELKQFLEDNGISCWIDVERVGMNGLFDDIAEGLLSAKVVIVCVSDEYASSPTCQIEFRYTANTLKLPIIMAAVGTGDQWRSSEVGLLSVNFPLVNFQEETKTGKSRLLKLVRQRLGAQEDPAKQKAQKNAVNDSNKNLSYQELFELAQRKLLRQLTVFAENQQDIEVYPRLFVIDLVKETPNQAEAIDTKTDEEENEEREEKEEKTNEIRRDKQMLSKRSSTMLPAFRLQRYCVYTLCEHDEGWHSVAEPIELPADFAINELTTYSPYLARMTTVMKYSKSMVLNCLTDDIGKDYLNWLEKSPDANMSDYQKVYHQFREMVHNGDTDLNMGGLMRCHLTNGRTIWLCEKHRQSMSVTCLSNEDKSTNHKLDNSDKNWMLMALRSMDSEMYTDRFQSVPLAKRIIRNQPEDEGDVLDGEVPRTQPKASNPRKKKEMQKIQSASQLETAKEPGKSILKDKRKTADKGKETPKVKELGHGVNFALQEDTVIEATVIDDEPVERPSSAASEMSEDSTLSRQTPEEQVSITSPTSSQLRSRNSGTRRRPLGSQPIHGTKGGEKSSRACNIS